MSKLNLSVIIPCYNAVHWIGETLESILGQPGLAFEVVVINDGSTDGSSAELRRFGGRIRVIETANRGVSLARRLGVRLAAGQYVKFVDADDLLPRGTLQSEHEFASRHQGCAILSRVAESRDSGAVISENMYSLGQRFENLDPVPYERLFTQATHMGSWVLPRSLAISPKLYPRNSSLGEEYAFCIGLVGAGVNVLFRDQIGYIVRVHESEQRLSATRSEFQHRRQLELIQLAIETLVKDPSRLSSKGRREIALNCWAKGRHALRIGCTDVGLEYIKFATYLDRTVDPAGGYFYRALVTVLGPKLAEDLLMWLKSALQNNMPQ